jgi:aryl-alcohol dehydrogenase-like predicted oxidoreductase
LQQILLTIRDWQPDDPAFPKGRNDAVHTQDRSFSYRPLNRNPPGSALLAETRKSVPQLALNWLLRKPTISSVIIGARNEQQLQDNLEAANFVLTAEQVARLDQASEPRIAYPYFHQRQFHERNPLPPSYRA